MSDAYCLKSESIHLQNILTVFNSDLAKCTEAKAMALCGIEMSGYLWLVLLPLPSRSVSLASKHQFSFVRW